ncbi:uncharacterized protein N7496_003390 [Penicillium cataractarum]|uniref:F-box domain-containing protein n=1 Tax=Penicillium cataractarum TaxID=2100454 RepID=A0A9W9SM09_9EURO|nr:uncharacterized protein N7496_003390 [Penicillium cataractarum]KAJ5380962.1 hypothetical protein N7496_003390 [Penicillium cataractarum]
MALGDLAALLVLFGLCYFALPILLPQVPAKDPPNPPDATSSSTLLTPFLLRLPESVREEIYFLLEYSRENDSGQKHVLDVKCPELSPQSISEWSSAHQRLNWISMFGTQPSQGQFANQLFYVSRAISQDARSFFYSHNNFVFPGKEDEGLPELSAMTMVAIQSFRNIQVRISAADASSDDGRSFRQNKKAIMDWKETCYRLAHAPPCQLSLSLISNSTTVKSAKDSLGPLTYLELKKCSIAFDESWDTSLQNYAEYVVSKTTERFRNQKSSAFHRFGDLPTELQMKVLEHTDLLPSTEIIGQGLKWHPYTQGFFPLTCMNFCCALQRLWGFETPCKARNVGDSSSQYCWSVPKALFQTSKSMKEQARLIFYRNNHFAFDIYYLRPFEMNSDGTPSLLEPFPPDCLQHLRSIQWNFPNNMAVEEFQPPLEQTIKLVQTVEYLRERTKISNLTLTLNFRQYQRVTRTPVDLNRQYALAKHMAETIAPYVSELKDFFVHIDWPSFDADQIKSMEQTLEKTVKGETYDSEERGKRLCGPDLFQWSFVKGFGQG